MARFSEVPLTVSWPHFREVDPAEMDKIEGLKPNKTRHASFVVVQPVFFFFFFKVQIFLIIFLQSLGIVTDAAERIQLNLWVKNIRAIPMLRPVANRQIPLFWAELVCGNLIYFFFLRFLHNFLPFLKFSFISSSNFLLFSKIFSSIYNLFFSVFLFLHFDNFFYIFCYF